MFLRVLRAILAMGALFSIFEAAAQSVSPPSLGGISGGGSVELGEAVELEVWLYPTASDYAFQWRRNDGVIPAATTAKYPIAAMTDSVAGTYTGTVTNPAGSSLGAANDVRIAGGSLLQTNHERIRVTGTPTCRFVEGSTSHGERLPAQLNRGQFERDGVEVTRERVGEAELP